jgi:hypothetical protein
MPLQRVFGSGVFWCRWSDKNVQKRNHEAAKGSLSLKELDCNPMVFVTVRDSSSPAGTFEFNGSKNAISNEDH